MLIKYHWKNNRNIIMSIEQIWHFMESHDFSLQNYNCLLQTQCFHLEKLIFRKDMFQWTHEFVQLRIMIMQRTITMFHGQILYENWTLDSSIKHTSWNLRVQIKLNIKIKNWNSKVNSSWRLSLNNKLRNKILN